MKHLTSLVRKRRGVTTSRHVALLTIVAGIALPAAAVAPAASADGVERVYERVSPLVKGGQAGVLTDGVMGSRPIFAPTAADGSAVLFMHQGPLGNAGFGSQSWSIARRNTDRWEVDGALPRPQGVQIGLVQSEPWGIFPAADLSAIVARVGTSPAPYGSGLLPSSEGYAIYRVPLPGGAATPLVVPGGPGTDPVPAPPANTATAVAMIGGSPDLRTVYVAAAGNRIVPSDTALQPGKASLYLWHDRVLEPAGLLPDGDLHPEGAAPIGDVPSSAGSVLSRPLGDHFANQVSEDGSRLFFVSPQPGGSEPPQLYVRIDGEETLLLSRTTTGSPAPDGVAGNKDIGLRGATRHGYASADGRHVFFQSTSALTADAADDDLLKGYVAEVAGGTVTIRHTPEFTGMVVAASDDLSRMLAVQRDAGVSGSGRLLLWDRGQVIAVAPINGVGGLGTYVSAGRSTADGNAFVFEATEPFAGADRHPQPEAPTSARPSTVQVYRYDVGSDELRCLSCAAPGQTPPHDARVVVESENSAGLWKTHGANSDLTRIAFDSVAALVPHDGNARRDVYEWTEAGTRLVTTGRGVDDAYFLSTARDGRDIFFGTTEALDPADRDGLYDVYVARDGGGFATDVETAPCDGDACQVPTVVPPVLPNIGSVSFGANGNVPFVPDRRKTPVRVTKLKTVRGSAAVLRVRVPDAGRIVVRGPLVRRFARSARTAGTYRLWITLNPRARKLLRKRKGLQVNARVAFRVKDGRSTSKTVKVTFKQPKSKRATARKGGR